MSADMTRERRITIDFHDLADDEETWLLDTLSNLIYGCPHLDDAAISATPVPPYCETHEVEYPTRRGCPGCTPATDE